MEKYIDEQIFLDSVKSCILDERANVIETIERIPHEYKGRYSQVKWGDEDLVKDLTRMYTNRLNVIENLEFNPYFGAFNFQADGKKDAKYRIGKTDIMKDGRILVLDWRNPICTLYYDFSNGIVSYKSPSGIIHGLMSGKEQIIIKDGEVKNVTRVELVSDDELLLPYLDVNADNRMKTIISSIQAEQNSIIRDDINKNIIVQGVAGSGKTSVALHRVAYLLYSLGKKFDNSRFGVIGPNKYFLDYISKVLPDLDTKGIKELTFEEICGLVLDDSKYSFEALDDDLQGYLSGNSSKNYDLKLSMDYKALIEQFLADYFEKTIQGGIVVDGNPIISEDELRELFSPKKGNIASIGNNIKLLSNRIKKNFDKYYYPIARPLTNKMKTYPLKSPERNAIIAELDSLKAKIAAGCLKELKSKLKPLVISPIQLYKLFLNQLPNMISLDKDEEKRYVKDSLRSIGKGVILSDDRAAILYLSMLQNNTHDQEIMKHIVIDEAQDYSMFEFWILRSLFDNSTFSIFGDIAQSIYPKRQLSSWDDVNHLVFDGNAEIKLMTKGYRTAMQITEEANKILNYLKIGESTPVIRNGNVNYYDIQELDKESLYIEQITRFLEKGYKSIGIVCKDDMEMIEAQSILDKLSLPYNLITNKDDQYNGGISILTSSKAKGLEFDAVIIYDASDIKYNTTLDMHLLYVALTRALHDVVILYSDTLTRGLSAPRLENNQVLSLKNE